MESKTKKIPRSYIVIFIAFVACWIGLWLWSFHWPHTQIELRHETLNVIVANTPNHWLRGLGGRENLGSFDGMLFLYPGWGKVGIVMRDMKFPIDIVWLDQGAVVDIAPSVPLQPGVQEDKLTIYYPRVVANMVLELPAGWAEVHGLRIGDSIGSIGAK